MGDQAQGPGISAIPTGGAAEISDAYLGWGRVRWVVDLPARDAEMVDLPGDLPPALEAALIESGRSRLYWHQRETIEQVREGHDVLLVTSTASGKTLAFNAAILDRLLREPSGHALYVYPTNALVNDQANALRDLVGHLPEASRPRVAVVTGQADVAEKQAARGASLVLTNPESIHYSLLQRPDSWRGLLGQLQFIVVDEAHMYRGAFGAHVSHVLRRLFRVAAHLGSRPQVIAASATIGNPEELAHLLTGRGPVVISRDGSARPQRQLVVWELPRFAGGRTGSYQDEAVELLIAALSVGRSAILFARSRKNVESLTADIQREVAKRLDDPTLAAGIRPYRGGYTGNERKAIEEGLRSGRVRAVISTNALEVGVDIGSLDVVIIAGYPGTMMAFWQQAGRAGRRGRTSQIFYVPSGNPLDEYFAEDPRRLVDTPHEQATFDPWNPRIAIPHILWRAAEAPIRASGPWDDSAGQVLTERLRTAGALELTNGSYRPVEPLDYEVSLRSIDGHPFRVIDPAGRLIGEVDEHYLYRECHPQAIYVHQGQAFRVEELDEGTREVHVGASEDWTTTTRVVVSSQVDSLQVLAERELGPENFRWHAQLAKVMVVDLYHRFAEYRRDNKELVREEPLAPPLERRRPTISLILQAPAGVSEEVSHAIEHGLQAMVPTEVMCDQRDFVGLTAGGTVYLYDRNTDGLGFAERAFERLPAIMAAAAERIASCPCWTGCPLCIQSPACDRFNQDLEKEEASRALDATLGISRNRVTRAGPAPSSKESGVRAIAASLADELVDEQRAATLAYMIRQVAPDGSGMVRDEDFRVSDYPVGARVKHEAFGSGRIVSVTRGKYGPDVVVDFEHKGRQTLIGGAGSLRVERPASQGH